MTLRQQPIPGFSFENPHAPDLEFEATTLAEVRQRVSDDRLRRVHRADFHSLLIFARGEGTHLVDFVEFDCTPGTVLWIRPGQVQRFGGRNRLEGRALLFTDTFAPPSVAWSRLADPSHGQVLWHRPGRADLELVRSLGDLLACEYARGNERSPLLLQQLLGALVTHLDRLAKAPNASVRSASQTIFKRFMVDLEQNFRTNRRVSEYADSLGYSVKTLNRACIDATGRPPKVLIDDRVVLEARRLLAHGDDPVELVGRSLGFSQATNFTKFFVQRTEATPAGFRRRYRNTRPVSSPLRRQRATGRPAELDTTG